MNMTAEHFKTIYEKGEKFLKPEMIVADAGYKTPAIARQLLKDRIEPLFPYKRPMTKEGFFKKYEYVYDEYYDCYICPENQILRYSTTNRDGYREYKSCGYQCEKMSTDIQMYRKQESCKSDNTSCLGKIYRKSRRYPTCKRE